MAKAAALRFRRLDLVQMRPGRSSSPVMYRATLSCGHVEFDRVAPGVASIVMFGLPRPCPYCTEGRNV
ncbi:MAG: hypothetical protein IT301_15155 [Dehalococcoidia bacterium]|nr:hypothetical protein [Dehalococcoidia bacterium]